MAKSGMFVEHAARCPSCGEGHLITYPDPKLYKAARRESDLHVLSYEWSVEGAEGIVPHHYFVWQCPSCLFPDLIASVEAGQGTQQDHSLRLSFRQISAERREALEALRALVPEGQLTRGGAGALLAGALVVSQLPEDRNVDFGRLGRIALRLGWVFRERGEPAPPAEVDSGVRDDLAVAVEHLDGQLATTAVALEMVAEAARGKTTAAGSGDGQEESPYVAVASSMQDKLAEMRTLLTMLQSSVLQEGQSGLGVASAKTGSAAALDDVLERLTGLFPRVPRSERQCLEMAVEAFERSYRDEGSHLSIEHSMTVLVLIVDLFERLGERARALDYVVEIYNSGMEHKRELTRRLDAGKRGRTLRAHDEKMLNRKIGIVTMAIRQAGETRSRLLDQLIAEHRSTIDRVVAAHPTGSARQQTLEAAGVPAMVITKLKAQKIV